MSRSLEQRTRLVENRADGIREIMLIEAKGYKVEMITRYQYRIEGVLDIFPTNRKYHHIRRNLRMEYIDLQSLLFFLAVRKSGPFQFFTYFKIWIS